MSDYVGGDLRQKIENPVQFQTFSRRRRRGQATRDSSRLRHCPANRYLPSSLRKQPERSRPIEPDTMLVNIGNLVLTRRLAVDAAHAESAFAPFPLIP
jgi:hypothetical protein